MSAREFWKTVCRLTVSGIDGYARDQEAARLHRENTWLRTLAAQFRVPLPNTAGGSKEIIVQRWRPGTDRWAVMNGENTDPKAWANQDWRPLRDLGIDDAFRYTLDDALTLAQQFADHAALEAQVSR